MSNTDVPGLWPSPITPSSLAGAIRLSDPHWDTDGQTVAWLEGRSDRGVIVTYRRDEDTPRDLTTDISVRAFVGYGGGDFTLAHGYAYFVGQADQRIYRQPLRAGSPEPITPAFGAASTPVVSPDGNWVAYVHSYEEVDSLAIIPADGSAWPTRIISGADFYMQPAWHPSGERLAWVEWDHPNMPWDGSRLCLAALDLGAESGPRVTDRWHLAGDETTGIFQPEFNPDGRYLYYISDETGWGHLYRHDFAEDAAEQLTSGPVEFGTPAWIQGMRRYSVGPTGNVHAVSSEQNFDTLVTVAPDGTMTDQRDIHAGFTSLAAPAASPTSDDVAVIASAGVYPPRVHLLHLEGEGFRTSILRRSSAENVPIEQLATPQAVSWTSFDGEEAYGILYLPRGDDIPRDQAPPVIVLCHGGPTSAAVPAWNQQAQFFATRGYAVLQVNYRGSTGYGRPYMEKLRGQWGVYDVKDSQYGVQALGERGLADSNRAVIFGGSAGGYTVFQSLVEVPGFYKAGVALYGVSNMFTLAADTHKFESRYLDSMLGPLPEAADTYRERSPIFHADRIVDPVAIFQGDIDRVVPREQSDSIVASLRSRGVPHEYHVYEGEGHGWRKTETIEHFYTTVERFLRQYVVFG
ncbi:MAG: prolyl oligopeptidase family serine peptidase [Dehalococcoidia bacterium]|nr:prolyl oligopeptidase family serine peptidase [Dehalococcoidia bacterium]